MMTVVVARMILRSPKSLRSRRRAASSSQTAENAAAARRPLARAATLGTSWRTVWTRAPSGLPPEVLLGPISRSAIGLDGDEPPHRVGKQRTQPSGQARPVPFGGNPAGGAGRECREEVPHLGFGVGLGVDALHVLSHHSA